MADAFIGANIASVLMLNEVADLRSDGFGITGKTLKMSDQSVIESDLSIMPGTDTVILSVNPTLNTVFIEDGTDGVFISYTAKHLVTFKVFAHTGFDIGSEIPEDAVRPYLEMALFIARSKATMAIRNMGVSTFTWPASQPKEIPEGEALHILAAAKKTNKPTRKTVLKKK